MSAAFCPLCGRALVPGSFNDHHLVPKSRNGRETIRLHKICHAAIHAHFTAKDLARHYNTIEALLAQEPIRKFVAWVAGKPPEFHARTRRRG